MEPQCAALAAALADAKDFSTAERAHRACLAALLSQVLLLPLDQFLACQSIMDASVGADNRSVRFHARH